MDSDIVPSFYMEEIVSRTAALENEQWRSKIKVLIELIMSSIMLTLWWSMTTRYQAPFGEVRHVFWIVTQICPLTNATAWVFWIYSLIGPRLRRYEYPHDHTPNIHSARDENACRRYEIAHYRLRTLKRTERFIDLLTGVQFIAFSLSVILLSYIW